MEEAREARDIMLTFSQERLDSVVECLAAAAGELAEGLAALSAEETGYGRQQDKVLKNRFICDALPKRLRSMKCVGILNEDAGEKAADTLLQLVRQQPTDR